LVIVRRVKLGEKFSPKEGERRRQRGFNRRGEEEIKKKKSEQVRVAFTE